MLVTKIAFSQSKHLLVGTYTHSGKSEGIYTYRFDQTTGRTTLASATKGIANPSYLTLTPDKRYAYSVNESGDQSTISAFRYDAKTGILTLINQVSSEGNDPCYLIANDHHVIVANYNGGNIAVFNIEKDGALSTATSVIKHTGKSINPNGRQESAHVHQVVFSPDGKYVLATDLGEDNVYIYKYNPKSKTNTLTFKSVYSTKAGSGPRHLSFSPSGKHVYLTHEFTGHIAVLQYNKGELTWIEDIQTVSPNFTGAIDAADIHVSADGKFLYQTNRGDVNKITVLGIGKDGRLNLIESIATMGKGPRNFSMDPSGKYVLVAHQNSDQVVIFHRDTISGKLTDSGHRVDVASPVCLVFE